jgi:hypothetical protein
MIVGILLLFVFAIIFQNCSGGGFLALQMDENEFSSSQAPGIVIDGIGLKSAKQSGVWNPNCLNDSSFDACIFWKNPVAQRATENPSTAAYSSILEFGKDIRSDQKFGIKLENLKSPERLSSNSLEVYYSGSDIDSVKRLNLVNGQFRQSYSQDGLADSNLPNLKSTAQLMAYFWLNHLQSELKLRTGVNYSEPTMTYVDAYAADPDLAGSLQTNAFFYGGSGPTERSIVMGYANKKQSGFSLKAHEMALSAEVFIHEMGHANLHAAKGNNIASLATDLNSVSYYVISRCAGDRSYESDASKNTGLYTEEVITQLQGMSQG